jgi:hypothetical protein
MPSRSRCSSGTLSDGTSYTAQTTLDAAAKEIRVVIQNAGHHPLPVNARGLKSFRDERWRT